MDAAAIVKLAVVASIALIVFSIGLGSTLGTGLRFVRDNPGGAARAMLAMFVAVPAFVLLVTWVLPLERPVRLALLALAVAPMPPILPRKQAKLGGGEDYIAGLLLLAPLTAIAVTPLFIWLAEAVYGNDITYSPVAVLKTLVMTLGAPLLAGMLVNRFAPGVAARLARPIGLAGTALLALGGLAILYAAFPAMLATIGNGALVAIAAMVIFGLLVGHALGGPLPGNRRALAICTASRHPGVALAVATAAFPLDAKATVGAVLVYLLVNAVLTVPYARWQTAPDGAPLAN